MAKRISISLFTLLSIFCIVIIQVSFTLKESYFLITK